MGEKGTLAQDVKNRAIGDRVEFGEACRLTTGFHIGRHLATVLAEFSFRLLQD